jgi:hypothetical protein
MADTMAFSLSFFRGDLLIFDKSAFVAVVDVVHVVVADVDVLETSTMPLSSVVLCGDVFMIFNRAQSSSSEQKHTRKLFFVFFFFRFFFCAPKKNSNLKISRQNFKSGNQLPL